MEINKTFDQCPNCGSASRLFETLAKELRERGLARDGWTFHWDVRNGVVIDKTLEHRMSVGDEATGYTVHTDICLDCGTVYAVTILTGKAVKSVQPPKLIRPGDLPSGLRFNNPELS